MSTQAAAEELRRAFMLRIEQLANIISGLSGPLGKSRSDLLTALDVMPTDVVLG